MVRPRHTKKDIEAVLKSAEDQEWRVEKGKRYFKMRCPCADKHMKTVTLTPSDPNYLKNLVGQLKRATCWKEDS